MTFLEFIHRYMRVLDRIRSTKEWLNPNYFAEDVFIFRKRDLRSPDIVQLDDKRFVEDVTEPLWGALLWMGVAIFFLVSGVIPGIWFIGYHLIGIANESPVDNPIVVRAGLTFILSGLCLLALPPIVLAFVYLFKRPKQRLMIFDRENGTVTLPPRFWGEHEVVPFHELKVKRIRNLGSIVNFYVLAAFRPSDGQAIEFGLVQDNWKDWGFYCWYMDKGRPLPPGEVFDPYR